MRFSTQLPRGLSTQPTEQTRYRFITKLCRRNKWAILGILIGTAVLALFIAADAKYELFGILMIAFMIWFGTTSLIGSIRGMKNGKIYIISRYQSNFQLVKKTRATQFGFYATCIWCIICALGFIAAGCWFLWTWWPQIQPVVLKLARVFY